MFVSILAVSLVLACFAFRNFVLDPWSYRNGYDDFAHLMQANLGSLGPAVCLLLAIPAWLVALPSLTMGEGRQLVLFSIAIPPSVVAWWSLRPAYGELFVDRLTWGPATVDRREGAFVLAASPARRAMSVFVLVASLPILVASLWFDEAQPWPAAIGTVIFLVAMATFLHVHRTAVAVDDRGLEVRGWGAPVRVAWAEVQRVGCRFGRYEHVAVHAAGGLRVSVDRRLAGYGDFARMVLANAANAPDRRSATLLRAWATA